MTSNNREDTSMLWISNIDLINGEITTGKIVNEYQSLSEYLPVREHSLRNDKHNFN